MNKFIYIILVLSTLFVSCNSEVQYVKNEGFVFGTSYHFTYQSDDNFEVIIKDELKIYNSSLSTYDPNSVISRVNSNDTTVVLDSFFVNCFNRAVQISEITDGAFDMTVAPVVNAWGFGFKDTDHVNKSMVDSLMQFVGYKNIEIFNNKIIKKHNQTMLDASAIAKGYGVDVVAQLLEKNGVSNYMVEIGGEVRAKGKNAKGIMWRIGIDKPIDDVTAAHRELQAIVSVDGKSLATSGNYRQFYEKDGVKYSHTINPKTGYPAKNSLLSASVLADDCITADAFATAFMVLGINKSIELSKELNYLEVYFIYTDSSNNYKIYSSDGFKEIIAE